MAALPPALREPCRRHGPLLPARGLRRRREGARRRLGAQPCYAGVAAILAIAAPIAAHQLNSATLKAREQGVALVLDASLQPLDKIKLAPALLKGVESDQPRSGLRRAIAKERGRFTGSDLVTYDKLGRRADETLITAVANAFRSSFLIAGAGGFIAALLLIAGVRFAALVVTAALAVGVPLAYAGLYRAIAPNAPAILDPCSADRKVPSVAGVSGFLQRQALNLLDVTACRLGSSGEDLVLALADKNDAARFKREHGVDPRTLGGVVRALLGG